MPVSVVEAVQAPPGSSPIPKRTPALQKSSWWTEPACLGAGDPPAPQCMPRPGGLPSAKAVMGVAPSQRIPGRRNQCRCNPRSRLPGVRLKPRPPRQLLAPLPALSALLAPLPESWSFACRPRAPPQALHLGNWEEPQAQDPTSGGSLHP